MIFFLDHINLHHLRIMFALNEGPERHFSVNFEKQVVGNPLKEIENPELQSILQA